MGGADQDGPLLDAMDAPEAGVSTLAGEVPLDLTAAGSFPVAEWDRYTFIGLLGRGGMGEVYEARDRRLGRSVALKFIRGADPDRVMRLLQEARAQARIDHPGVCRVYEVGEVSGRPYIAMQRIDGQRLDLAAPAMSLPQKVQVVKDVAEALHEAHRLGVIHRDLKPSNILVRRGEDGRWLPVLMDFGLAYEVQQGHGLTETGALVGTPSYMAPEQARGDVRSIDRRSDVYSLGATLYELLTGVVPFTDATAVGTLAKVLHEEPLPPRTHVPRLPGDLQTVVLKCLSKEPEHRYASARALAEDLGRYIDGEPILGRRPGLLSRLRRRARKHRALVTVSALSLLSILLLAAYGVRSGWEARRTREQSEARARLAEQLGQQVKEVEWFLRVAATLPLHDTSAEQQQARERMARIAAWPHEAGGQGEALVHYALGRGHLAMLDPEAAHAELMKARELGLDTPELHYALGRVLGELYHRALESARRSGGPEWVAARQRELEGQYLVPALQALERSRGSSLESPHFLEGLIAFYRRDHETASRAAARAAGEAGWMYEARRLAGDVAYARAMEALDGGGYDAARTGLQEAGALYAEAAEVGRSDARTYEALAGVGLQLAEVDQRQGRSRRESLERALEASERALKVAPWRASGHTRRAHVLMGWYRLMKYQGGGLDPKPILAEWIATAARAVALDPRDAPAHDTLGYAHFMRGLQEARDGADPMPAWEEASTGLRRALALEPHYPWALNDLAMVYRWKGRYQEEHGQDPGAAYAEAERHFQHAASVDPKYLFAWSNLGDLYVDMAAWRLSRGLSPEAEVQKALQAGEQALGLDGQFYWALNQVALAELTQARFLFDSGGDARPAVARAFQHLERAGGINAAFGRTPLYRAMGHHLIALQMLRDAGSQGALAKEGRKATAKASARVGAALAEPSVREEATPRKALAEASVEAEAARKALAEASVEAEAARKALAEASVEAEAARKVLAEASVEAEAARRALAEASVEMEVEAARRALAEASVEMKAARRALAEASARDSGCVDCRVVGARLELAEAEVAQRLGRPALPWLQRALTEARRAVSLYPYLDAHQALARVCWKLAEAQPASAASASAAVDEGLAQVAHASRLHPQHAQSYALQGGLLLTRARGEHGARAEETRRQAQAALARALELNPLLRHEYAQPLREVRVPRPGEEPASTAQRPE
jgi:hypothetical protein